LERLTGIRAFRAAEAVGSVGTSTPLLLISNRVRRSRRRTGPGAEITDAPARRFRSSSFRRASQAICDALERELGAERAVLPGVGHTIPRHPDFNRVLADFVDRAAARVGRGVEAETEPEAGAEAGAGAKA
jgi:hypothetical protein